MIVYVEAWKKRRNGGTPVWIQQWSIGLILYSTYSLEAVTVRVVWSVSVSLCQCKNYFSANNGYDNQLDLIRPWDFQAHIQQIPTLTKIIDNILVAILTRFHSWLCHNRGRSAWLRLSERGKRVYKSLQRFEGPIYLKLILYAYISGNFDNYIYVSTAPFYLEFFKFLWEKS